ncbi:syntenin-2 isoform X4 [Pogoniulus pusillus]|uniref:syntenin-2 isoform X4 n=1 Tax=Pogoniulus pusillus TaxID=488313 RepID=UPI0030B92D7C
MPLSPGTAPAAAMATLYPSLEDMKGHQILQAQAAAGVRTPPTTVVTEKPKLPSGTSSTAAPVLYPNLAELESYMGLALSSEEIQKNLEDTLALSPAGHPPGQVVAPLSGHNAGLRRAEIKAGVREVHLCKDERGKTGLQLKNVDQGIFVQLVKANSPAALVGLRFGDQVLQIDGRNCAGWSSAKAQRALKKASPEKIVMVAFPAHCHPAQGQHRAPWHRGEEGQDRVAGQGQLRCPQRAPHAPLPLRGQRPERHWHEG